MGWLKLTTKINLRPTVQCNHNVSLKLLLNETKHRQDSIGLVPIQHVDAIC